MKNQNIQDAESNVSGPDPTIILIFFMLKKALDFYPIWISAWVVFYWSAYGCPDCPLWTWLDYSKDFPRLPFSIWRRKALLNVRFYRSHSSCLQKEEARSDNGPFSFTWSFTQCYKLAKIFYWLNCLSCWWLSTGCLNDGSFLKFANAAGVYCLCWTTFSESGSWSEWNLALIPVNAGGLHHLETSVHMISLFIWPLKHISCNPFQSI